MICKDIRVRLDLFLDRQLAESDSFAVEEHLASCGECRAVWANRRSLRLRVKSAVQAEDASADLAHRVQFAIAKTGTPRRFLPLSFISTGFGKPAMALAASVLIAAGAYYFWPDRQNAAPKETQAEFIDRVDAPLAPVMRVGFRQHLHCGVFREYPAIPPALADFAREKAVSPALIDAVESHAPFGLHAAMAHKCTYKGREYIHIVARGDGHLMSLLITKRGEGEDFPGDLKAAAVGIDLPVFATAADTGQDRYSIDAFEASGYLVYLISDSAPTENLRTLEAISAQVRAALL